MPDLREGYWVYRKEMSCKFSRTDILFILGAKLIVAWILRLASLRFRDSHRKCERCSKRMQRGRAMLAGHWIETAAHSIKGMLF